MSAAMAGGQRVDVGTDGNGGVRQFPAPDGNDAESSYVRMDFVGMVRGQLPHDEVVGVMLVARYAGVGMEVVSYLGRCHRWLRIS